MKLATARPSATWIIVIVLALCSALSQTRKSALSEPRYRLVELPLRPLAVSATGWVAGVTPDQKAAIWSPHDGLQKIALPPEFPIAEATGINNRGEAVGTAYNADSSRRIAFLFRKGKVLLLAGEQPHAVSVNDAGTIVGQARLPGAKATEPVTWKNADANRNKPEPLGVCCAGVAKAINQHGQVVGDTYDTAARYHAFLWAGPGRTQRLDVPEEKFSSAIAINDVGQIVLRHDPGGYFLYQAGKRQKLDLPQSQPLAINNHGLMVGGFGPDPDKQSAFVWDKTHGRRDLNGLIAPNSGWTLEVASGINERGEIVGWGDHDRIDNAGFLLVPQ